MTEICRRPRDRRTLAEKQEAALLAAFRLLTPRDQVKLLRMARRARPGLVGDTEEASPEAGPCASGPDSQPEQDILRQIASRSKPYGCCAQAPAKRKR